MPPADNNKSAKKHLYNTRSKKKDDVKYKKNKDSDSDSDEEESRSDSEYEAEEIVDDNNDVDIEKLRKTLSKIFPSKYIDKKIKDATEIVNKEKKKSLKHSKSEDQIKKNKKKS